MVMLRREKRFYIVVGAIVCVFFLNLWLLDAIRTTDTQRHSNGSDERNMAADDEPDLEDTLEESDSPEGMAELPVIDAVALAEQREALEQAKQEARNRWKRLIRRLTALSSELDEAHADEQTLEKAWSALETAGRGSASFSQTMAEDFVAIRKRRALQTDSAGALSERHELLLGLLRGFGTPDLGATFVEVTERIDELESAVEMHSRNCREIARSAERLAERARNSDRGGSLFDVVARLESAEVAPELQQSCNQRETEITEECDTHLRRLVAQTKRDAEARAQQQRASSEEKAEAVRKQTADALAADAAEEERLDLTVEKQRAAVYFERDRAKIEYYLVPFIALKRTYTTPALLDDEIKEFAYVAIPLEKAASLAEIEQTGAFESGPDSYERLEPFAKKRMKELDERCLPFGQPWSCNETDYLILARELLMKHGPAMVEAGLLRP